MAYGLLELAAKVEAASGPSYALECEIWDAIYPGERDERFRKLCDDSPYKGRLGPADKDGYVGPLRSFTASLDAAITLVPEERMRTLRFAVGETGVRAAFFDENRLGATGTGATRTLALLSAALRSLAYQEARGDD